MLTNGMSAGGKGKEGIERAPEVEARKLEPRELSEFSPQILRLRFDALDHANDKAATFHRKEAFDPVALEARSVGSDVMTFVATQGKMVVGFLAMDLDRGAKESSINVCWTKDKGKAQRATIALLLASVKEELMRRGYVRADVPKDAGLSKAMHKEAGNPALHHFFDELEVAEREEAPSAIEGAREAPIAANDTEEPDSKGAA